MNSSGIAAAGGVGKYMAEWIIDGQPSIDLWSLDIRRFIDMHKNKKFLKDRVTEVLGECIIGSDHHYFSNQKLLATRLHSSRMRTARA